MAPPMGMYVVGGVGACLSALAAILGIIPAPMMGLVAFFVLLIAKPLVGVGYMGLGRQHNNPVGWLAGAFHCAYGLAVGLFAISAFSHSEGFVVFAGIFTLTMALTAIVLAAVTMFLLAGRGDQGGLYITEGVLQLVSLVSVVPVIIYIGGGPGALETALVFAIIGGIINLGRAVVLAILFFMAGGRKLSGQPT